MISGIKYGILEEEEEEKEKECVWGKEIRMVLNGSSSV